jgi:paired amphipathic helix protein Sin3a
MQPLYQHQIQHSGQMTAPDELIFFDNAKKALEIRETYDEFLKLLDMYTKDIIDVKTLLDRAQLFFGDGELLCQFKNLMGWDDKQDNVEYGPPGSIRTGPPEALSAVHTDDGQGPSYRRLPDSVG